VTTIKKLIIFAVLMGICGTSHAGMFSYMAAESARSEAKEANDRSRSIETRLSSLETKMDVLIAELRKELQLRKEP